MSWRRMNGECNDENLLEELRRYMGFGPAEESRLRAVAPLIVPHAAAVADTFYARLLQHENARNVFSGPEQMARLHATLINWLGEAFTGPWDAAYYERRARIGRMHVRIDLPQRYMFGAMNTIRLELRDRVFAADLEASVKVDTICAIDKLLDLELALMLETYREGFIDRVRQAEQERQRLLEIVNARYDRIVEETEALIVTFDEDGRIELFNAACERLTGHKRTEAIGKSFTEIFFPGTDATQLHRLWQAAIAGEKLINRQIASDVDLAGKNHYVRWQFSRLPSEGPVLLCALGMDVTESRDMYERARRAEQLAGLGTMAAGLAHEIRNPLNAAHLQLTLVQRRLARVEGADVVSIEEAARVVASELERLALLVSDFLQFARPRPPRFALVDLVPVVRDVVDLLEPQASAAGVTLDAALPDDLFTSADHEYLKQVLHNLVRNAIEACETSGHVAVTLRHDGTDAVLEVRDDGRGFSFDKDRIFEPFFTTKENGTGLGLAIVHRIVTEHNGHISLERIGVQTVVRVTLPAHR